MYINFSELKTYFNFYLNSKNEIATVSSYVFIIIIFFVSAFLFIFSFNSISLPKYIFLMAAFTLLTYGLFFLLNLHIFFLFKMFKILYTPSLIFENKKFIYFNIFVTIVAICLCFAFIYICFKGCESNFFSVLDYLQILHNNIDSLQNSYDAYCKRILDQNTELAKLMDIATKYDKYC